DGQYYCRQRKERRSRLRGHEADRISGRQRTQHTGLGGDACGADQPDETNHNAITGPKNRPTFAVPIRCTAKSAMMITTVIGMINGSSSGPTTRSPSTAESTEI